MIIILNQILKRCNFIIKYLTLFYKKPIYYFGFYQSNIHQNYGLNTNIIINLKENNENKETEEESTNDKNDEKNNFESSSETNEIKQNNNSINEDKKTKKDEEQNKQEVEKQNQNNNDKINVISNNKINDDDKKLERINVDEDFSLLKNLPANIMIFQLNGEIFGEKLIYEKEELNLLGNLREDVKDIKINIQNIIERQNKNEKILLNMEDRLSKEIERQNKNEKILLNMEDRLNKNEKILLNMEDRLSKEIERQNKNEKILLAIAQKFNVKIDDIEIKEK